MLFYCFTIFCHKFDVQAVVFGGKERQVLSTLMPYGPKCSEDGAYNVCIPVSITIGPCTDPYHYVAYAAFSLGKWTIYIDKDIHAHTKFISRNEPRYDLCIPRALIEKFRK